MVLRVFVAFVLFSFLVVYNTTVAKAEELMLGFYDFPDMSDLELISETPFKYVIPYGLEGSKKDHIDKYLRAAKCRILMRGSYQ